MKKFKSVAIIILSVMFLCVLLYAFTLKVELRNNEVEITNLKNEIATCKTYSESNIKNCFWTGKDRHIGTIQFDDLSDVKKVTVSFIDQFLFEVEDISTEIFMDREQNTVLVRTSECHGACFCVVGIHRNNGFIDYELLSLARG